MLGQIGMFGVCGVALGLFVVFLKVAVLALWQGTLSGVCLVRNRV